MIVINKEKEAFLCLNTSGLRKVNKYPFISYDDRRRLYLTKTGHDTFIDDNKNKYVKISIDEFKSLNI